MSVRLIRDEQWNTLEEGQLKEFLRRNLGHTSKVKTPWNARISGMVNRDMRPRQFLGIRFYD